MTKIFFCIHNAIGLSPGKLSKYMYLTLCNGQCVYKHTRGHLWIDIVNNHWSECHINNKSVKNLTSLNWIFACWIVLKTNRKLHRPSHRAPSMCQHYRALDWVQSIELEAPKRNRARPWHLNGQLINVEYGKMWQAVV